MDATIDAAAHARRSVKALQVAVDALGMIAGLGGVQADWAMNALREIDSLICADASERAQWPLGRTMADTLDTALGEGRR
jgi:hypothetical protein